MPKGDVVLITFPFTDLSGSKLRPAVILTDSATDLTVAFITTQLHRQEATDLILFPNSFTGIIKPSILKTGKIATLDKSLAKGLLGKLTDTEMADLNVKLKVLLQLS